MAEIEVVADLPETCAASRDPLRLLPSEVLIRIVSLLDDESLLRISMASPKLADVSRHEPVVRRRIEKQIALEMAKVEEDSDACKDLWSHVIYMWEARCPFIFKFKRPVHDNDNDMLNDLNKD